MELVKSQNHRRQGQPQGKTQSLTARMAATIEEKDNGVNKKNKKER
jgi:hypothetical protein